MMARWRSRLLGYLGPRAKLTHQGSRVAGRTKSRMADTEFFRLLLGSQKAPNPIHVSSFTECQARMLQESAAHPISTHDPVSALTCAQYGRRTAPPRPRRRARFHLGRRVRDKCLRPGPGQRQGNHLPPLHRARWRVTPAITCVPRRRLLPRLRRSR